MWRLLEHRLSSFEANSAITQSLIRAISEGTAANTARFYHNSGKVVTIGRYQKQENEVREDYCRRNKIKIQRRLLPGDAILSSEEDVWWEFIAAKKIFSNENDLREKVIGGITAAFSQKGLEVEVYGSKLYLKSKIIGHIFSNEIDHCFIVQGVFLFAFAALDYFGSLKIPTEKINQKSIHELNKVFGGLGDFIVKHQMHALMVDFASAVVRCRTVLPGWEFAEYPVDEKLNVPGKNVERMAERALRPWGKNVILVSSSKKHGDINIEVAVLIDIKTRKIKDLRLSGNFDCIPANYAQEIESKIVAAKLSPNEFQAFFSQMKQQEKQLRGISLDDVEQLIVNACRKVDYINVLDDKVNEISFVGMNCEKIYHEFRDMDIEHGALLLPYCSKLISCQYRNKEGCSRCGRCDIGDAYSMADAWGLKTQTIQNYEMLEETLKTYKQQGIKFFIGICCPPFIAKHYDDFDRIGLPGLLIHLDNTTCYDIGREDIAHSGRYENQTFLNVTLLDKIIGFITSKTKY